MNSLKNLKPDCFFLYSIRAKMKNIMGLLFVCAGLIDGSMPASELITDWRLQAFDKANVAALENSKKEMDFLVGKDPTLSEYFTDVVLPYNAAVGKVRRIAFLKKLERSPESIKFESSPYVWALDMPPNEEINELLKSKDEEFRLAYSEYSKRLSAYRAAGKWFGILHKIHEKYPQEIYAIESELPEIFADLDKMVKAKLADQKNQKPDGNK